MKKINLSLWGIALLLCASLAACMGFSEGFTFTASEAILTVSSAQNIDDMIRIALISRTESTEHPNRVVIYWPGAEHMSETFFISGQLDALRPIEEMVKHMTARNLVVSIPYRLHQRARNSNSLYGAPNYTDHPIAEFDEIELFQHDGRFSLRAEGAQGLIERSSTSLQGLTRAILSVPTMQATPTEVR